MSFLKLSQGLYTYSSVLFLLTLYGAVREQRQTSPCHGESCLGKECEYSPRIRGYEITGYFTLFHAFTVALAACICRLYHQQGFPKRKSWKSWDAELLVLVCYLLSSLFHVGVLIDTTGKVLLNWSCTLLGCFYLLQLYLFILFVASSLVLIPFLMEHLS